MSVVTPTEKGKVVLPASFGPKDIPKTRPDLPVEQDDDPVSDEATFLDDSEAGEADEEHIFDLLTVARSTALAFGSFATSKVHLLCAADNGSSDTISVECKTRLKRSPKAQIETAELFVFGKHVPCIACQRLWLDHINTFFHCASSSAR